MDMEESQSKETPSSINLFKPHLEKLLTNGPLLRTTDFGFDHYSPKTTYLFYLIQYSLIDILPILTTSYIKR